MEEKKNSPPPDGFPYHLVEELGEVRSVEQLCPGVYYLSIQQEAPEEYFAVLETAAMFSRIKPYGLARPGLRLCSLHESASGWRIVEYELHKYQLQQGRSLPAPLQETALYASEIHPEYFGEIPAPGQTPDGGAVRRQRLDNGIYWLETSVCTEWLAVCYPVWDTELTDMAQALGRQTEYDRARGIHRTLGYLFFPPAASCIAIYELMQTRRAWEGVLIDRPALMNAIWSFRPDYAVLSNRLEQSGWKNFLARILDEFGIETDRELSLEHIIPICPDAGSEYLLFRREQ